MKVLVKIVSVLVLLAFAYDLCQSQDAPANNAVNSDCAVPNQRKTKGVCVKRADCLEYEELFNVTDLTTERLSFIMNLGCGFDYETWKSLVCCPKPGDSYKYVVTLKKLTKEIS